MITDPTEKECDHIYGFDKYHRVLIEVPKKNYSNPDEMYFWDYCPLCGEKL